MTTKIDTGVGVIDTSKYSLLPEISSTLDSTSFKDSLSVYSGAALEAVGLAGQVYSTYNAYKLQAQYQKSVGRINQMLLDFALETTKESESEALAAQERKRREVIGAQQAGYAAQGVDIRSGTPQSVQRTTNFLSEIDSIRIRNNASRQAFGYKIQSLDATSKSQIASDTANQRATGTLLSGGLALAALSTELNYRLRR